VDALQLDLDAARTSPLHGRVVFVLATPETGAERLLAALDLLPGVTTTPVPTHLFSQGIGTLLDTWVTRTRPALGELADDQRFLRDLRALADEPLLARRTAADAEWIVEYTPDHITSLPAVMAVYPDALFLHLVRDGRQVAAGLSSLFSWPPSVAVRRWCDDQRAALALGDGPNVLVLAMEVLLDDPRLCLGEFAARLGLDVPDEVLGDAAAALGDGARTAPEVPVGRQGTLTDVLGGDLLSVYGYDSDEVPAYKRLAARLELGTPGDLAWALRAALDRARRAGREES
jgi:Sulfotransferase family